MEIWKVEGEREEVVVDVKEKRKIEEGWLGEE